MRMRNKKFYTKEFPHTRVTMHIYELFVSQKLYRISSGLGYMSQKMRKNVNPDRERKIQLEIEKKYTITCSKIALKKEAHLGTYISSVHSVYIYVLYFYLSRAYIRNME